jgi:anti-sigma B factor antagonist
MKLEWTIDELLQEGRKKIVLDMTDVAYLDSSAIGVLINCRGKVGLAAGQMRLANPTERVVTILKVSKIYDVLAPDASREAAIAQLPA